MSAANVTNVINVTTTANAVLLDTGPIVALYAHDDRHHATVQRWLSAFHGQLHTVAPVLTEAAFFLPPRNRAALAELVAGGTLQLHAPDAAGHGRIATLMRKYADLDPDWADVQLVWLAEATGIRRIATLDIADFSVYRINGRVRFEMELLR